jgi:hypothetical protein
VTTDEPRIQRELFDGQDVFVPTTATWLDILRADTLDGLPVPLLDWVSAWLEAYSRFPAAALGLVRRRGG